jgi:hypothetical protein
MTLYGFIGLLFVLSFLGLMIIFYVVRSGSSPFAWRPIPGFKKIQRAIGLAVEDGTQLHVSLGRGGVTNPQAASAFVGLSMMEQLIRTVSESDHPPVATSGSAPLSILAQDTISGTYQDLGLPSQKTLHAAELTGLTPYSYAAGTLPIIRDDEVSANIFAGWYGSEVTWLTAAAGRQGSLSIAGTAHLPGQAIMYATASEPLIGEELFAGGAYLGAGPMHEASLKAQDIFRWVIVVVILGGILLKLAGFDFDLNSFMAGVP